MKLSQFFVMGVILSSAYMIGCGSKFESSVVKAKGKPVPPGVAASVSNTTGAAAAGSAAAGTTTTGGSVITTSTGETITVPAMCAASITVDPSDIKVYVRVNGVKKDLFEMLNNTPEEFSSIDSEDVEVSGIFDALGMPQSLNLTLNGEDQSVGSQTFNIYTGSADNNYSMNFQVKGQCLTNMCKQIVLVLESVNTDHRCEASNVQLGLYMNKNKLDTFSFEFIGENLSFEEIKSMIVD